MAAPRGETEAPAAFRLALDFSGKKLAIVTAYVAAPTLAPDSNVVTRTLSVVDALAGTELYSVDLPGSQAESQSIVSAFQSGRITNWAPAAYEMLFSPDETMIAVAMPGQIHFVDSSTGDIVHTIEANATDFTFSPDSRMLAVNAGAKHRWWHSRLGSSTVVACPATRGWPATHRRWKENAGGFI